MLIPCRSNHRATCLPSRGRRSQQERRTLSMNRLNKSLAATFMSAAMIFTGSLQAKEIRRFDKMADQDQVDYLVALVAGAEKVLTDEGRPDLAAQVHHLFTTKNPGDEG